MNVMAKAHELTRNAMAKVDKSVCVITYRQALSVYLREAHRMNKEEQSKKAAHKAWAIAHFEDCIAKTVVHFEALSVNDYYIAIENNKQTADYTLLQHKNLDDVNSPLGWANYQDAIKTHSRQADEYIKAFPGVCKLHAMSHLQRTIEFLQIQLDQIKAN